MKFTHLCLYPVLLVCIMGCATNSANKSGLSGPDGVFIHVSHGAENPHRVLMAMKMAELMADAGVDVLMYFDIKGIDVVLEGAPDLTYSHFPSSCAQLKKLVGMQVDVLACPGCLKAAGKTPDDLAMGVKVASKEAFFGFTEGRILTLDY